MLMPPSQNIGILFFVQNALLNMSSAVKFELLGNEATMKAGKLTLFFINYRNTI